MLEPTDIDETYVGGLETIKHASKKMKGAQVEEQRLRSRLKLLKL